MMRRLLLGSFLIIFSSILHSNENLEPENTTFSRVGIKDYYPTLVKLFDEAFKDDAKARMVTIPSFAPESVIFIKKKDDTYKIIRLEPKLSYWPVISKQLDSKYRDYPSNNVNDIEITKCESNLEPKLAIESIKLWKKMLFRTRYSKHVIAGADGVSYHFSVPAQFHSTEKHLVNKLISHLSMAGRTWSPRKNSTTELLVSLANSLAAYCMKQKEVDSISNAIENLKKRLKNIRKQSSLD